MGTFRYELKQLKEQHKRGFAEVLGLMNSQQETLSTIGTDMAEQQALLVDIEDIVGRLVGVAGRQGAAVTRLSESLADQRAVFTRHAGETDRILDRLQTSFVTSQVELDTRFSRLEERISALEDQSA